jgi:hypothetical protein
MKSKIRILVTHQVHYLTNTNNIILLEDGAVKAQGTYNDIVNLGIDINFKSNKSEPAKERKISLIELIEKGEAEKQLTKPDYSSCDDDEDKLEFDDITASNRNLNLIANSITNVIDVHFQNSIFLKIINSNSFL